MTELTDRQRSILIGCMRHVESHGDWPALRTIGDWFGMKGPTAVRDHLAALERKAYLKYRGHGAYIVLAVEHGNPVELKYQPRRAA